MPFFFSLSPSSALRISSFVNVRASTSFASEDESRTEVECMSRIILNSSDVSVFTIPAAVGFFSSSLLPPIIFAFTRTRPIAKTGWR